MNAEARIKEYFSAWPCLVRQSHHKCAYFLCCAVVLTLHDPMLPAAVGPRVPSAAETLCWGTAAEPGRTCFGERSQCESPS